MFCDELELILSGVRGMLQRLLCWMLGFTEPDAIPDPTTISDYNAISIPSSSVQASAEAKTTRFTIMALSVWTLLRSDADSGYFERGRGLLCCSGLIDLGPGQPRQRLTPGRPTPATPTI